MSKTTADLAARLKALTPARVRLDGARVTPLKAVLDFQLSHARARDAIRHPVDWAALSAAFAAQGCLQLQSQAVERDLYLRRPDLGRRLSAASRAQLAADRPDLAIVIADGLSGAAVNAHAAALTLALIAALPALTIAPPVLVEGGRVAIGDEIGAAMGAGLVLVLIGERPGLSVPDSLGAYLTLNPKPGTPDSARNCVSNIHTRGGMSTADACDLLCFLITRAREIGATGTRLKDDRGRALP